jgi:ureidoacrylate peracid hydrolase
MAKVTSDKQITALLVIDPYNDFISKEGKIWNRIRAVAEANDCVPHMLQVLNVARKAKPRVFYALHHRYRPGDYETWKYIAPIQKAAWMHKRCECGTWGGEIRTEFEPKPGEIVATEHWCSSGFANTDLDLQVEKHGIHQLIVIGLIAHTCIESTVAMPPSSATTSRWSKTRRRITRMKRCTPLSTSISRTTPVPS